VLAGVTGDAIAGAGWRLLGPVALHSAGDEVDLGPAKQRAVLAVLLLAPGRTVGVDTLIDRVWGDRSPRARNAAAPYVTRLRRILDRVAPDGRFGVLRYAAGGYRIDCDADLVDLHRARRLAQAARAAGRAGDDQREADLLGQALDGWQATALAGLTGEWAARIRAALHGERSELLARRAEAQLRLGRYDEVVDELRGPVAEDPTAEGLVAPLLIALAGSGRPAEALDHYAAVRAAIADQLGTEPSARLHDLYLGILRNDPTLTRVGRTNGREVAGIGDGGPVRLVPAQLPAQLPADVTAFTGRDNELAALDDVLAPAVRGDDGRTVGISVVSGTAGVGKTALAVRWAHRVAGEFPDGQVYLNLRGYDPDQPMTVADALTRLLTAVGVPPTDIPVEVDERAARFRSQVAGRRLLILLDNAATVDQVRPLLPGTASCAVVVTSRDSLAGLVAREGAHRLDLDLLPRPDALALLRRLIDGRVDADPAAAAALADQCARLPLALRVAAELAMARPDIPLADLVSELADQQRRLDLLDAAGGDPRTAVAAVFSWSVRHLPADTAQAFRLLGVHPGPDIDPYAAAALIGTGERSARRALESLARAHLVYRTTAGRYAMHDLLRAYACDLARQAGVDEHGAALDRLLDYYVGTTAAAMDRLHPAESHVRPAVAPPATDVPVLADRGSALAWLDAERQTLAIVAAHAAANGRPAHTVALSALLFRYLTAGYPTDALVIHGRAREAAKLAGDRRGESTALHGLGGLHWQLGRYEEAMDHFQQALALARKVGYRMGEARALGNLGAVEAWLGRYRQATEHCGESLALFRRDGDRIGEARAINNLGLVQQRLGRYREAAARYAEALALFRAVGELHGEANTLTSLGDTEQRLGRTDTAADHYERALALYRRLGDRAGEAWALDGAGTLATRLGQTDQAEERHRHALEIFCRTGDREGEAWARNGLGEAAYAAGRPADALDHHRAALAVGLLGPLDQPARAHTGLGRAHAASGDVTRARAHYETALAIYEELGTVHADEVRALIAALTDRTALACVSSS
jgi:DNA-binding SARP family transcriptional activator/Tfp pilus assembly protein PilF